MNSEIKDNNLVTNTEPDLSVNLLDILASVWRWRKQILYMTLLVAAGTIIVSLFLPNYYTAECTFVPANEEKDLFGKDTKNNSMYGDEEAIDRALIFANSAPLIEYMIKEFKLAERFEIDASTPKGESRVSKRFLKLFKLKKNEHSGIEVSMQDKDPKMAAQMLSTALNKIDELYKQATLSNKDLMMQTYENALSAKRNDLSRIGDSLYTLRKKYSVFDVEKQGELLAELMVETESQLSENVAKLDAFKRLGGKEDSIINIGARIQGLSKKLDLLKSKSEYNETSVNLNAYNESKEKIMYYDSQILSINDDIGEIIKEYTRFKSQTESKASSLIILEPVQIPKIKSYPIRSLMTLAAVFISLVVGMMAALVLDLNRRIDWNKVFSK
jgi:capsule polysaccharide export protein KpsE/RkpR